MFFDFNGTVHNRKNWCWWEPKWQVEPNKADLESSNNSKPFLVACLLTSFNNFLVSFSFSKWPGNRLFRPCWKISLTWLRNLLISRAACDICATKVLHMMSCHSILINIFAWATKSNSFPNDSVSSRKFPWLIANSALTNVRVTPDLTAVHPTL